ncbi:adenylate cyclase [Agrilactobacillus composti DSM 18527 = JCM 14202]|nr:CYTH domain-containing protein [Agrilactobacillus composti]GAF39502.1 adenylate cyclase [Agrilactobacillus composti DSM 18527 = JCM 14202]
MSKELEVEYKNLLTRTEFAAIQKAYDFQAPIIQENHYFDTPTASLKQLGIGLRIRQFVTRAEQTMKIPTTQGDHHLIEITDPLSLAQSQQLVDHQQIWPGGSIGQRLIDLTIPIEALKIIGFAKTTRYLWPSEFGLLTLDQTSYQDHAQDFECELELTPQAVAKNSEIFFMDLLDKYAIPKRPVINKVVRAISHFQKSH